MYGVLHKALTAWLGSLDEDGTILRQVEDELPIEGKADDFFRFYERADTEAFLQATSIATGKTIEECKYLAGMHFLNGVYGTGYAHTIQALGSTLFELLDNLDSLHQSFIPSFPEMQCPSFRPIRCDDGTMLVKYYSEGSGLSLFAMGALQSCASQLFEIDCNIKHVVKRGENGASHDEFRLYVPEKAFPEEKSSFELKELCTLSLPTELTDDLLPWHFAFDNRLNIVSLGSMLRSRLKEDIVGKSGPDYFKPIFPVATKFTLESLIAAQDAGFTFVIKKQHLTQKVTQSLLDETLSQASAKMSRNQSNTSQLHGAESASSLMSDMSANSVRKNAKLRSAADHLKLHGQIVFRDGLAIFAGTPLIRTTTELNELGLQLCDMPLHSHARDVLFGSMFLASAASNAVEVDRRLAELDTTMKEVEEKKGQIDQLLHSILPPIVANSLAKGSIPPAERYTDVTVLMADVHNFTQITSEIPPGQVMSMLHELFIKFDDLTEKHGCYKVETNGDAYMVACGCPEQHADHAERVAYLAIDMVQIAKEVLSPLDGEPLHVRIGLHSGPLMAGVVGRARPRYCLFGDTVNMTAQMMALGLPGAIQATYRFVMTLPEDHPLKLISRGHIPIDGKGYVKVFLLLGSDFDEEIDAALPEATTTVDIAPMLLEMTESSSKREATDRLAHIQATRSLRMRNAKNANNKAAALVGSV